MIYKLTPYMLVKLETNDIDQKFRLTTNALDVEISKSVKKIIDLLSNNQGKNLNEVKDIVRLNNRQSSNFESIFEYLLEKKFIVSEKSEISESIDMHRNKMDFLNLRIKLIDIDKRSSIFEFFSFLISPFFILLYILFFLLISFFLVWQKSSLPQNIALNYSNLDFVIFFSLSITSSIIHELFHAIAMKKFKQKCPLGIGCGLYIIYWVFFTDTHESLNLERNKRILVSSAGIFGNIFFIILTLPFCIFFEMQVFIDFYILSIAGIVIAFNPFLKMDGYWIASDLIGIFNIQSKLKMSILGIFKKGKYNYFSNIHTHAKIKLWFYITSFSIFISFFTSVIIIKITKILLDVEKYIITPVQLLFSSAEFNLINLYIYLKDLFFIILVLLLILSFYLKRRKK